MDTPNATRAPDPTRANAALWAHYIEQQWGAALTPVGGALASGLMGMAIANAYALVWGEFIGELFSSNAPQVTSFVREQRAAERLAHRAVPLPQPVAPPFYRVARRDAVERVRERELMPVAVG
jgi:hypothetical protein